MGQVDVGGQARQIGQDEQLQPEPVIAKPEDRGQRTEGQRDRLLCPCSSVLCLLSSVFCSLSVLFSMDPPHLFGHGLDFDGVLQERITAVPLDEIGAAHEGSVLGSPAVVVPHVEVGKVDGVAEKAST